jgi:hypothetical protein
MPAVPPRLAPSRLHVEMKTIPTEQIEATWERICQASREESSRIAQRIQRKQPFVMIYLLASDDGLMEGEDRGKLLELGTFIYEALASAHPKLRKVTGDELEEAEDTNLEFMATLDEGSEMGFIDSMQKLMVTYNQMPLLGAVLEALMQGYEDHPELAPDSLGMALLHLKTVIDCLDQ